MPLNDAPIQRKLMVMVLLASVAALLLMRSVFFTYEFLEFRAATLRQLSTVGQVIAANSTASLAFDNVGDANEILAALKAEQHIVAAALYNQEGKLFAKYPRRLPNDALPTTPGKAGYQFQRSTLAGFQPVVQGGRQLGTLYLKLDTGPMIRDWLRGSLTLGALVLVIALVVAYLISKSLQRQISQPILALAETARAISDRRDYSVRATKRGQDELGTLTDAFNHMLTQIQEQNHALRESEARVRAVLNSALSAVVVVDAAGKITDWNARAESMFGWKQTEVLGLGMAETIIPPRYREAHHRGIKNYLATGEGPVLNRSVELHALRRNGTEFPVELSISPLKTGDAVTFCGFITDISERRRMEEVRMRMAALVQSSDDAIFSKTLDGKITSWNPAAERLFGYTAPEAIDKPMLMLFPTDRVGEEAEILTRIRRGASVEHFETERVRQDGKRIEVSVTISPIRDSGGNVIGASTIARDITERNLAQRALAKSEAQMRLMWDNALDGMRLVDKEGVIRMVNEAYCRAVGKSREELEGKPLSVLFEPQREQEVLQRHCERFRTRSVPPHVEREVTLWNGRQLSVELSNSFLEVAGQPPLLFSTFRDISERRRAEKREAAFARLSQSLSAVASAPAAARIIADMSDELFGWDACSLDVYESEKDLIYPVINIDTIAGRRVDVPPAYAGQSPSPLVRLVLRKGGQLILRPAPCHFSGETVPFGDRSRPSASLVFVPIRRGERIIGILSIQSYTAGAYDQQTLTTMQTLADQCGGALERVRAEDTLRRLNEELEQRVRERTAQLEAVNKELEAFSYSVSHDLRAPLRHISGFTDLLGQSCRPNLDESGQRYLGIISDAARQMGALIDDLLVFSRMGRAEMRRTVVKMDGLVAEVLREMERDLAGRDIAWDIGPLPEVTGDRAMLKQVWVNLLSNAVKYTRQREKPTIKIASRKNDHADWEFSVQDNGAGFDMQYAGKLFGVFQRLHQAEEFEGTGIGLANVQRIVLRHGGRAWAEGKVDTGATFSFTLPDSKKEKT